jgi:hypothetical protein
VALNAEAASARYVRDVVLTFPKSDAVLNDDNLAALLDLSKNARESCSPTPGATIITLTTILPNNALEVAKNTAKERLKNTKQKLIQLGFGIRMIFSQAVEEKVYLEKQSRVGVVLDQIKKEEVDVNLVFHGPGG